MSTVIINHSDSRGGASVVSLRLLEALCAAGHDATMLVAHKAGDNPCVHTACCTAMSRLPFLAEHLRIFAGNGFNRADLFKVSIATDGLPLHRHPLVRNADTVILNWVNQGMLSLDCIARMAADGKRLIWTMHDMWNLTGICHHAGTCTGFTRQQGCSHCPMLHARAGRSDLSAHTWRRKRELYSRAGITFVAVSNWLAEKCRCSPLMDGCRIEVIPNAFPIDEFHTAPRTVRKEAGLPEGRIVLMGAARLDDPVKGLPLAVEALNRLDPASATYATHPFWRNCACRLLWPERFPTGAASPNCMPTPMWYFRRRSTKPSPAHLWKARQQVPSPWLSTAADRAT